MKILFIIDTLGSGGKERRLSELLKSLKSTTKVDFELVVMSNDIHYREVLDLNIKVHKIIRKNRKDLSVFKAIYLLIKKCKPDIVHCWDSMTAVYVTPACKLLGCKLVNGMIIDAPQKRNVTNKHWLRARLTFPFSDIIVGNSQAGLKAYKAPKSKSVVVYNGFNFNRVDNLVPENDIRNKLEIETKHIVGMVANFWWRKDYPTYFRAAQILLKKRRDVVFLAIGSNTDLAESQALIEKEYNENFRLLGRITGTESFINAMDICVLSTFTEGISNAILEYMALGKPVIATVGGGTAEIVADQVTGFLVEQSNPEDLARSIEVLLDNPILCKKMGSAGKERIRTEFSIDKMVKEYTNLYAKLWSS
jgi:glycosyltransferase involved in cell wall biosynthesis